MTDYIKRLGLWIWEGKYPLLLPIITLIFFIDKIPYKTEDNLRYYGYVLEVIGTLTIAIGLKDKLVEFKGHGFLKQIFDHLNTFPLKKAKGMVNINANISAPLATVLSRAKVTIKPKDDDLKEVIRYFEDEIQYLTTTINELRTKTEKEINKIDEDLSTIKNQFSTDINEIKLQVKESAVSNIWLELFGLCCLLLGLTLGTIPDLIVKLI